jgi:hypothetical protein
MRWSMLALALLTAGCVSGTPKINDNWPAMQPPHAFTPEADTCHASVVSTVSAKTYNPVDCGLKHLVQTIHVGQLSGAIADLPEPPELSDTAAEPAYAECDKGAAAKLGRNWRDFQFDLLVRLPAATAWQAGARWVRCDLVVPADLTKASNADLVEQTGPLDSAKLLLGCFDYKSGADARFTGVDCTTAHNAEYVGSDSLPPGTKYPETDEEWNQIHERCFALTATFVGVSIKDLTTGVSSWVESQARWTGGDRSVRCYLWLDKQTMITSAKGTKGAGIPAT